MTLYGVQESGGRIIEKDTDKRRLQSWKTQYIQMLIDTGEFPPEDKSILRDELEIIILR